MRFSLGGTGAHPCSWHEVFAHLQTDRNISHGHLMFGKHHQADQ